MSMASPVVVAVASKSIRSAVVMLVPVISKASILVEGVMSIESEAVAPPAAVRVPAIVRLPLESILLAEEWNWTAPLPAGSIVNAVLLSALDKVLVPAPR